MKLAVKSRNFLDIKSRLPSFKKKKTAIHTKPLKENQNLSKVEELERKKLEALVKK